eukprot:gb/GFBE01045702.1/.p1 GENE.gb/GFBE01045702.1/~~gb/GFBE01045702.1/.p1  ORF type:complete len:348 (+),score=54.13 gb/GFBE01045702.1/:1-1044(+)
MAEEMLRATGVSSVRRFRASCVASVCCEAGFDCVDAMRTIGGGVLAAHCFGGDPRWNVDLKRYDVEIYGFLFHDTFACGILLGGQWRRNTNEDKYSFSTVPFGERASRPYMVGDHQPWFMPRLRPSTAVLLLTLAGTRPGEAVLDPMGGCGTIAIEAAAQFEGVRAVTSDNHKLVTSAAIKNCVLARPHLASGSSLKAEDWDACNLSQVEGASIDRVITDMPFGNKCRWDVAAALPVMLGEVARVLRPGGRAVLLMKGYKRLEALLAGALVQERIDDPVDESELVDGDGEQDELVAAPDDCAMDPGAPEASGTAAKEPVRLDCLKLLGRRPVAIGGYLCYALTLEKS